jgi:DNA polymerase-4
MNQRKIIHIDQDCFYAAVEIKDNPSLKGKPVAVGGSPEGRGVLTTASYEARKFGVKSAMSTSQALRLCPQLILVPVHFHRYKEESAKIRKIFAQYTDQIQPLSLDEAYLDVTHHESATLVAQQIRKQIFNETQLTASAGIAPNKFLAKIASDWRKPNGQFTITPDMIGGFIRVLKVEKIPGVGKVTAKKMHKLNFYTCSDLQKVSIADLNHYFGNWGIRLYDLCRGIDHRPVKTSSKRKSLSVENTFSKDLKNLEECLEKLPKLYEEFYQRLDKAIIKVEIHALVIKIKFHDFTQTTLEISATKEPSEDLYTEMLKNAFNRGNKPVRLIGIGVKLKSEKSKPQTLQMDFKI